MPGFPYPGTRRFQTCAAVVPTEHKRQCVSRHSNKATHSQLPSYEGAGKRRAVEPRRHDKDSSPRHPRRLPPANALLGALALIGAAGGALSGDLDADPAPMRAEFATTSGPSSGAWSNDRRQLVVSRSAPRQASPLTSRATIAVQRREAAMKQLEVAADRREQEIQQLQAAAEQQRRELLERQWTLPVSSYRLTGLFGQSSYLWSTVHTGLDFAAPEGTPIYSVGAGTVTEAAYAGSYGYRTIVTLADGTEIWYCHQSSISVAVGSAVSRGEVVGLVGSTGNVTGPHLHLEVRPGGGDPVDPYAALAERGAQP